MSMSMILIELSQTMMVKGVINAPTQMRDRLRETGICDYTTMAAGSDGEVAKLCTIYKDERSYPSRINMYHPKGKREPRFWISGLVKYADPGQFLEIEISDSGEISIHISDEDSRSQEATDDGDDSSPDPKKDPYPIKDLNREEVGSLKHDQVTFSQLMRNEIVYVMPRFQREYSWNKTQFSTFWQDVNAIWFGEEPRQFLGPLVMRVESANFGNQAGRTWVVDGQQRLTTIYAINVAMAELAQKQGFDKFAEETANLLFIQGGDQVGVPNIHPTVKDQNQFNEMIKKIQSTHPNMKLHNPYGENTLLMGGYKNHLRKGVKERCTGPDGKISLEKLVHLKSIINDSMLFIEIVVPKSLNVHKVFDRLNTQGKRLSVADLVRNLIFEKLIDSPSEADQLHSNHVLPMEKRFEYKTGSKEKQETKSKLSDYYFPFALTLGIDKLTKGNMFEELRKRWKDRSSEQMFEEINSHVDAFLALSFGTEEKLDSSHPLRSNDQIDGRINRLFRLKIPTGMYPYLLPLLKSYQKDHSNLGEVVKCLDILESFQVRRNFSGYQSAGFQTLFRSMWKECDEKPDPAKLLESIEEKSGYDYPNDDEFKAAISNDNVYNKTSLCRYVLNEYELSIDAPASHKREVLKIYSTSTSEHIIPQKSDLWEDEMAKWKIPAGYSDIADWLEKNSDTLANLSILQGWQNAELQNEVWAKKREYYRDHSPYRDSKAIARDPNWNIDSHEKRKGDFVSWALTRWQWYSSEEM